MNDLWRHQTKDEAIDDVILMLYALRNGIEIEPRLGWKDINTTYIQVKGANPESVRFVFDLTIDVLNAFKDGGKNNG